MKQLNVNFIKVVLTLHLLKRRKNSKKSMPNSKKKSYSIILEAKIIDKTGKCNLKNDLSDK